MSEATNEAAEFGHEVRLGLVLYGGVSLAIYMNGTTNELYRAVRGRGVYFLIKHLLGADIGVDVASGASAGGINGIFLSFALANDREFGTCANLWRRDGNLGSLFRKLEADTVPSVLDSQHYVNVLENGFRVMWKNDEHAREPELATPTPELDLFVAGTDFYGRFSQEVNATGRVIETKQHRTLFWLKHRHRIDAKCQLDPRANPRGDYPEGSLGEVPVDGGLHAFAKLAQITSCFPGAFAPVHVVSGTYESTDAREREADEKLTCWGKLDEGEHYFVDGGVLDNKPFTSTLDTIFLRPAHRKVCRHVLYLEPDPERFSPAQRGKWNEPGRLQAPAFVPTVVASLTSLPSYESIAGDLSRIAEHNASIQRFDNLVEGLASNEASRETYEMARLLGIGQRVNAELAAVLAAVEFESGRGNERTKLRLTAGQLEVLLRKLTVTITGVGAPEATEDAALRERRRAERSKLLRKLDIDFHIRRLMALTYLLEPASEDTACRELWKRVNQELQLLEIVRSAMESVVVPPAFREGDPGFVARVKSASGEELWDEIRRRTLALLSHDGFEALLPSKPEFREPLDEGERRCLEFRKQLADRLSTIRALPSADLKVDEAKPTLLEISGERLALLLQQGPSASADFFARFEREDAVRYPLELAAGIHQRDEIHVVRLSPFDAKRGLSDRKMEDKISGETFGHFGAFLKKSWRSNDLLWGRLDGICRLTETLLLHTRFGGEAQLADGTRKLPELRVDALLLALAKEGDARQFLGRLFPHLEARIRAEGERAHPGDGDQLSRLLEHLEKTKRSSDKYRAKLVDLLIETAQLDALSEDLPKVIADSAEEQLAWGQRKVAPTAPDHADGVGFEARDWQFKTTSAYFDGSLLGLATREFARLALDRMGPDELAAYFRDGYVVGSESALGAMPGTVLVDLGARGAVLTERALVGSGKIGKKLRSNGAYRLVVRLPLNIVAGLGAFLRRSPQYVRSFVIGSVLYTALAIVANVFWFKDLYGESGIERTVALFAFALLPLVCLLVAWLLWRPGLLRWLIVVVLLSSAGFGIYARWPEITRSDAAKPTDCVRLCP